MSGVVKSVKKVFKKVVKVIKKIAKPLLIAAAIYFTAGLALSAMPATASFAASLPGFAGGGFMGLGIGAGKVAGAGIFSKIAAGIGLGGGLAKGAAAAASAAAPVGAAAATAASQAGTAIGAVAPGVVGSVPASMTSGLVATTTKAAGMTLTEKLILASTGSQVLGALVAPSADEVAEAQARWRGAFYGVEGDGSMAPPAPAQQQAPGAPGAAQQPTTPGQGKQLLDPMGFDAPRVQPPQAPQVSRFGAQGAAQQPGRQLLPEQEEDTGYRFGAGRVA